MSDREHLERVWDALVELGAQVVRVPLEALDEASVRRILRAEARRLTILVAEGLPTGRR
jgi:hypothetical protein